MQRYRDRLPVVAAALLVAATVLFVVGTTLERSQARTGQHQEAGTAEGSASEAAEHSESAATQAPSNATTEAARERFRGRRHPVSFSVPTARAYTATITRIAAISRKDIEAAAG